jgi:hypothetical protein
MTIDQVANEQERLLAILEHWHKIEFFIPFDLKERADRAQAEKNGFYLNAINGAKDFERLKNQVLPENKEIGGFTLFLGVFDKGEVVSLCETLFPAPQDPIKAQEDKERGDIEGETCFAELRLSATGEPLFDGMQASTLPWALGKSHKHGIDYLSSDRFRLDWGKLETQIFNFEAERNSQFRLKQEARRLQAAVSKDTDDTSQTIPNPLTFVEIVTLVDLLRAWADFSPKKEEPIAFVEMWVKDKNDKTQVNSTSHKASRSPSETEKTEEDQEEEEDTAAQTEIGILNSFYIDDLEQAICHTRTTAPENLLSYVSQSHPDDRIDLFEDHGKKELIARLAPNRNVKGRWFDAPDRFMSLMQQFAINAAFEEIEDGGIFSVNGPPGTGKTTLLKEIFAENIVRRAEILARFRKAASAFTPERHPVSLPDATFHSYQKIRDELAGFEMVVVSSNNAAVENISRELPQTGALSGTWRDGTPPEYLRPIAYKIAAQKPKNAFRKLTDSERPWGLISCVLGNKKNRNNFLQKFSFPLPANEKFFGQQEPAQNIYTWIDSYSGISFDEARQTFLAKLQQVEDETQALQEYANSHAAYQEISNTAFLDKLQQNLQQAENNVQRLQQERDTATDTLTNIERKITNLREEERLLDRQAPAWWERLFATAHARRHKVKVRHNANQQQSWHTEKNAQTKKISEEIEPALADALQNVAQCRHRIDENTRKCQELEEQLSIFKQQHPDVKIPENELALEKPDFQKEGLWQTQSLANARSELFNTALALHQAWLAEAGAKGQPLRRHFFMLSTLLQSPDGIMKPADIQALWQSFFMIVPVVSTTFASFGRQFKSLGENALGWIFVDEAGQATPQSAVGAVLRGKRVVAVGDPRQIEPVFTVPERLITAICDQSPHTAGGEFAPNRTSVQELSDKGNPLGAVVGDGQGQNIWIGSPLRVHRRCIDPMFHLANTIAYQNTMVFGKKSHSSEENLLLKQQSCWIDIRGDVENKQTVPAQNDFVSDILMELVAENKLPDDVFVITPFKEIKRDLHRRVQDKIRNRRDFKIAALDKWCSKNIGTVHTFQGKEANIVIFVLGCSTNSAGGANWASSKPNLLNVALTRAKQRIYIIGDKSLWGCLPSFSLAAKELKTVTANEFQRNLLHLHDKVPASETV